MSRKIHTAATQCLIENLEPRQLKSVSALPEPAVSTPGAGHADLIVKTAAQPANADGSNDLFSGKQAEIDFRHMNQNGTLIGFWFNGPGLHLVAAVDSPEDPVDPTDGGTSDDEGDDSLGSDSSDDPSSEETADNSDDISTDDGGSDDVGYETGSDDSGDDWADDGSTTDVGDSGQASTNAEPDELAHVSLRDWLSQHSESVWEMCCDRARGAGTEGGSDPSSLAPENATTVVRATRTTSGDAALPGGSAAEAAAASAKGANADLSSSGNIYVRSAQQPDGTFASSTTIAESILSAKKDDSAT